jgi:flagellar assembly factor FliW
MAEAARQELTPGAVAPAAVTVRSQRFGTHAVPEDCILTFPEGLVGIPHAGRFWLAEPSGGPSPFRYLLSVDVPDLGFLVCDPCQVWPTYAADVPRPADVTGYVLVLAIVTVRGEPRTLTANLLAPLVVDCDTRQGRQVVLDGGRYSTRHPLTSPADPPSQP